MTKNKLVMSHRIYKNIRQNFIVHSLFLFSILVIQVFHDGAVVPGWEGKIVAWVEEDHGERR